MTATDCSTTSNVMAELDFEQLNSLGLLAVLDRVPFAIQQRKHGFTPKMRCMTVLVRGHGSRGSRNTMSAGMNRHGVEDERTLRGRQ
ncbi:MAG: hypothetical protein ACOC7R_04265 [Planctomycetota bacterium]